MMLRLTAACSLVAAAAAAPPPPRTDLRSDGVPVALAEPGQLEAEFERQAANPRPFQRFSDEFVRHALATGVDWREKGAVTPAKDQVSAADVINWHGERKHLSLWPLLRPDADQGAHGYCGTFGRTCAAEGQYAIHSGYGLRNFSEEELVDCIGWDKDQPSYFFKHGFMDSKDYPYCTAGYKDQDPPIPGHPCVYDKEKVILGTADYAFNATVSPAHNDEAQLAAWIFKNGPVNSGVDASVFGLRKKGCEATGDCFITKEMCANSTKSIDHSITLVGFGTDSNYGDYWIVKNSWSTKFANNGFIKLARGYTDETHPTGGCAHIACCGWVPCYGDCPTSGPDVKIEDFI